MTLPVIERTGWRGRIAGTAALVALLVLITGSPAYAVTEVPGYRTDDVRNLTPGVGYRKIVSRDGPLVDHIV